VQKIYRYKQITAQGKLLHGLMFAAGEQNAVAVFEQSQNHLVKLRELSWLEALILRPHISDQMLLNLTTQCYQLLKAGVAIQDVFRILANIHSSNFLHSSLMQIRNQLLSGAKLSQALRAQPFLFDALYCHTIQVGEEQSGLIDAFEKLVAHLQKRLELKRKMNKALFYPAVMLGMMILLMTSLSIFLLPQLKDFILSFGFTLSWSTRILLWFGENIERCAGLICVIVVGSCLSFAACYYLSERFALKSDRALLKVPLLSDMIILYNLTKYLIDFRIFCNDGRSVVRALQEAPSAMTNHFLRRQLQQLSTDIHQGDSLTKLFMSLSWFPEALVQMIKVGESSGNLTQALVFCEEFVQNDLWSNIEKYLRLLEPLLLLTIGGFLLWIVVAVFLPLYDHLGVL
jgi:type II secretory pathway component PulF